MEHIQKKPHSRSPRQVYQLEVSLRDTDPLVWRRLLVPSEISLRQLHDVIQMAMGWEDQHFHEFDINGGLFGDSEPDELMGLPALSDERAVILGSVMGGVGAKAIYTYDFGDYWQHDIVVEEITPARPGEAYPVCIDGDRQCPPEDCGGTQEFSYFWRAIIDRYHPRRREFRRWLGRDFDRMAFPNR